MSAVKLIELINKNHGVQITLKTIFDYPSIEALAGKLDRLSKSTPEPINKAAPKKYYPSSPAQNSIWLAAQKEEKLIAYNMAAAFMVTGKLEIGRIRQALLQLIHRYEILRTNFIELHGASFQKINPETAVQLNIKSLQVENQSLDDLIQSFIHQPFDLEKDLLLRIALFRINPKKSVLVFCTHHIIMDGWSLGILVNQFTQLYNHPNSNPAPTMPTMAFQFKDYSEWLVQSLEKSKKRNEKFWHTYLDNFTPTPSFRRDVFSNRESKTTNTYEFKVTYKSIKELKNIILNERVTIHSFLAALLNILIHKSSNHCDICIGTLNAGRNAPGAGNQIGMFVKTLPLRISMDAKSIFKEILKKTQSDLLQIDQHQDIPPEQFREPLFDVLLNYQDPMHAMNGIDNLDGLQLDNYFVTNNYSRLPLVLNFVTRGDYLIGNIEFDTKIYQIETIQMLAQKWLKLLETVLRNPLIQVGMIDLALPAEKVETIDIKLNF